MQMFSLSKLLIGLSGFGLGLTSCGPGASSNDYSNDLRYEIYKLATADGYSGTYEEWLASIRGRDGTDGRNGLDGHTPTITVGENGHWFIDGLDTGVSAKGEKGNKGDAGENGKNGSDGLTPYIGENNNWWIGNTDTGVKAIGKDGAQGQQGEKGVGITSTTLNSENELIITFSDNSVVNVGKVTFTEHVHTYKCDIVEPTCTKDGLITFTCTECGHVENVINKTQGHIFETWREVVPATCDSDGKAVRYCTLCNEKEEKTIEKHDHRLSADYIFNAATHWHYCELCGVAIDVENHVLDNNNVCTKCGYEKKTNSNDGMIYSLNSTGDGYLLADYGNSEELDVVIPEMYDGKPVVGISTSAFADANIKSVSMPDTIKTIGANCFSGCKSLTTVILSKNIKIIPERMFEECRALKNITIPNGVERIESHAFYYCNSLTKVILPNTVTYLGGMSFYRCEKMTELQLSSNLSTIGGMYVFAHALALTNLIIPNGCKVIGNSMFDDCTKLNNIFIPKSMTTIDIDAFSGCSNLTSAIFEDTSNWRLNGTEIAKEVLADESLAAKKLVRSQGIKWTHTYTA